MAGGVAGGSWSVPSNQRNVVTTTRTRDDITTTLTNIDTKSDAWGKVIPMSFGKCRVGGALVWASQFYKTTESFDDLTTEQSIVTWTSVSIGDDALRAEQAAGNPNGSIFDTVVNTPEDVVTNKGSQVTHGTSEAAFIDLCYSFGTDGDTRKTRYIEKIRINDTLIYDTSEDYIADGIGFSIRYGYDNAAPSLLEDYPNGKFHYKGQTLVIFNRFPLALFGGSIPDSIDVEYGCCVAQTTSSQQPCFLNKKYLFTSGADPLILDNSGPLVYRFEENDVLMMFGDNPGSWNVPGWTQAVAPFSAFGRTYACYKHILSQAEADQLNTSKNQFTNGNTNAVFQVYNTSNGVIILTEGDVTQTKFQSIAGGAQYNGDASGYVGYGDCFTFDGASGAIADHGDYVGQGDHFGYNIDATSAPAGGWVVFSSVCINPCLQIL